MNYILGSASPCLVYSEWGLVQQSRVGESVVAGLKEINKKQNESFPLGKVQLLSKLRP